MSTITVGEGRDLRFSSGWSNTRYGVGDNELPVQRTIAAQLQAGSVFFDIGANVGFMTVIGARLVGQKGRVYAFEPVPENVAVLRRNLRVNGFKNVTVVDNAVSEATGRDFLVLAEYSGGSALSVAERPPDAIGEVAVDTVSIDDLIAARVVLVPSFVKIDVEGAEIQVLKGMSTTLRRHFPTVLYEIDGANAASVNAKSEVCRELLESHGYQVTQLENSYPDTQWMVEHYLAIPAHRSKAEPHPV